MNRYLLLLTVALTSCSYDAHGIYGTPWIHKKWAEARTDGTLACVDMVDKSTKRVNRFDIDCRYEVHTKTCYCAVVPADRFSRRDQPVYQTVDQIIFSSVGLSSVLSPGLSWPGSAAEAVAGVEAVKTEDVTEAAKR